MCRYRPPDVLAAPPLDNAEAPPDHHPETDDVPAADVEVLIGS